MNITEITKRDGRKVKFDETKIIDAISKTIVATGGDDKLLAIRLATDVLSYLQNKSQSDNISVEDVQDVVEKVLIKKGHAELAKAYILYRAKRTRIRESNSDLMDAVADILVKTSRENANISNSPSAKMLQIASAASKTYYLNRLIPENFAQAHIKGDYHIHDLDFYGKTLTCVQIPLGRLLTEGFNNGHGYIRPPRRPGSAGALAAIVLQSSQNDMHGGQSFAFFDRDMASFMKGATEEQAFQAMEALIYNLNSMHCLPSWEEFWVWDSVINELLLVSMEEFHSMFEKDRYYAISLDRRTGISEFKLITNSMKKDNHRRLVKLKTNLGQTVTSTDNHLILSTDGKEIIDVYPEEIDKVITPKTFEVLYADSAIPIEQYGEVQSNSPYLDSEVIMSLELAELFGYYVADGSIIGDNSLCFTVCHKIEFDHISNLMETSFGVSFKKSEYDYYNHDNLSTKKEIRFSVGVRIARMFKDLAGYSSRTKKVPKYILLGLPRIQRSFLRAYFDCDGRRNSNYENAMSSSKLLISQINLMIKMLGECAYISTSSMSNSEFRASQDYMYGISLGGMASVRAGIRESTEALFEIPRYDFSFYREHIPADKKYTLIPRRRGDAVRSSEVKIINDELNDKSLRKFEDIYPIPVISKEIGDSGDEFVYDISVEEYENFLTRDGIYVHNSRAGAQVPFSSLNIGGETSEEGRMVARAVLLAYEKGLGHGENPIFPNIIFRLKEGVNLNPGDPNYDLFRIALRVTAKRLNPTFSFMDSSFNAPFGDQVGYMGCRTRVMSNNCGPEVTDGRGNLSFTTINLPRLAIKADGDINKFFQLLFEMISLTCEQLYHRFKVQAKLKVKDMPFLMGQGLYLDSEKLKMDDVIESVIKHGTLSVGFIGLAETLTALMGKHHGESAESQLLGEEIVSFMRKHVDEASDLYGLNYSLLATPAEGLSGRFVKMDQKEYGSIPGVTDKDYYTNSFHVPVGYEISAYDKIKVEGVYHKYTNAGHISYVEFASSPINNLDMLEDFIHHMKNCDFGYAGFNFPIDFCESCNYFGLIDGDECPSCGDTMIRRVRRITGYLSTIDSFNDAKQKELEDRTVHAGK